MILAMNKQKLPLIIAIALPIIFIVIISVVIFLPSVFVKPAHDFIYTTEGSSYGYPNYRTTYSIKNDRIVSDVVILTKQQLENNNIQNAPVLYRYDVVNDTSHEITFEEAQKLSLDPGPSSPDGYTVSYEYGHDGIFELFGSNNNNNGYFIGKGNGKKKLSNVGGPNERWYQGRFSIIGWVK